MPSISIVVPVRDRADFLACCLDSLRSQDYPLSHFEIIVCDDGSRQMPSGAVESRLPGPPALRLVCQDGRGPAAARNLGIRESRAPIIVFIDSDVVPERDLVRRLAEALTENPDWAGAEACLVPEGDPRSPLWEAPDAPGGGRFHTAAIAYRRNALISAGGLDETFPLPACEDVELAARILKVGPIGFVRDAVARHPRRRVGIRMHWRARLHWKYLVILAKRYGFLAFPERTIGRFSRLRVAYAAVVGLPLGRLRNALAWAGRSPMDSVLASLYALFDILCGVWALPSIFCCSIPERIRYLEEDASPLLFGEMGGVRRS